MNKKANIFLGVSLAVVIGVGVGVYKYNHQSVQTSTTKTDTQKLTDNINDKVKFSTESKEVRFKTQKEMQDYAKKINTIQSVDEASNFITDFYQASTENEPAKLMPYFFEYVRKAAINNKSFPWYDSQNIMHCDISNIDIKDNGKNVYTVAYTMKIYKDSDSSLLITENRQDTIELLKSFEKIYITNYKRHTVSSNKS